MTNMRKIVMQISFYTEDDIPSDHNDLLVMYYNTVIERDVVAPINQHKSSAIKCSTLSIDELEILDR